MPIGYREIDDWEAVEKAKKKALEPKVQKVSLKDLVKFEDISTRTKDRLQKRGLLSRDVKKNISDFQNDEFVFEDPVSKARSESDRQKLKSFKINKSGESTVSDLFGDTDAQLKQFRKYQDKDRVFLTAEAEVLVIDTTPSINEEISIIETNHSKEVIMDKLGYGTGDEDEVNKIIELKLVDKYFGEDAQVNWRQTYRQLDRRRKILLGREAELYDTINMDRPLSPFIASVTKLLDAGKDILFLSSLSPS